MVAGDDKPISSSYMYKNNSNNNEQGDNNGNEKNDNISTDQTNLIVERKIFTSENLISESDAIS